MFITAEEMQRRLNSGKNLSSRFAGKDVKPEPVPVPAPKPRIEQIPDDLQPEQRLHIVAGSLARQGVAVKDVAKELGLSEQEVRNAALPASSPSADQAVASKVQIAVDKVRDMAIDKMMISLGLMTPDKFIDSNLKDLSQVAANLAKVVQFTAPQENNNSSGARVIIYAPQTREEKSYTVIDV